MRPCGKGSGHERLSYNARQTERHAIGARPVAALIALSFRTALDVSECSSLSSRLDLELSLAPSGRKSLRLLVLNAKRPATERAVPGVEL